jgi:hypothetical protein
VCKACEISKSWLKISVLLELDDVYGVLTARGLVPHREFNGSACPDNADRGYGMDMGLLVHGVAISVKYDSNMQVSARETRQLWALTLSGQRTIHLGPTISKEAPALSHNRIELEINGTDDNFFVVSSVSDEFAERVIEK